jgi:hypothetical protein
VEMSRLLPNKKITGANAGGRQLPMRTRRAACIAQFCRCNMRRRKLIAIALFGTVALLVALPWWPRCPVEFQFVRLEAVNVFNVDGTEMGLLEVRVLNRRGAPLEFYDEVHCEAKVDNRWVEIPDLWTIEWLEGANIYGPRSPITADVNILVPANATACRFQLKYRYLGNRPLPLGIGDPWARHQAPGMVALRVQQVTALVNRSLYDRLWPVSASMPGRWRKLTAKVGFEPTLAFEEVHSKSDALNDAPRASVENSEASGEGRHR